MKKYILLIAGYNYKGNYDYETSCRNRMNLLLDQNLSWQRDASVEFVLFSFEAGTISKNRVVVGSRQWQLIEDHYAPITRAHYDRRSFRIANTNVLSITDVYEYVLEIGRTEPGTIMETNIIGHAYFEGPILVNSYQRPPYKGGGSRSTSRDPWDKDGRRKDFKSPNMPPIRRRLFKLAFHADGYFWVWGCTFPRMVYSILHQTFSRNRKPNIADYRDSDILNFSYNQSRANRYYRLLPIFFPSTREDGTVARTSLNFTKSFGEVKRLFKSLSLYTYAGYMALSTGLNCRGAFIGTWSEPEKAPIRARFRVESIYKELRPFPQIIEFFQLHLGLRADPENRGYAIFDATTMRQWYNELKNTPV